VKIPVLNIRFGFNKYRIVLFLNNIHSQVASSIHIIT